MSTKFTPFENDPEYIEQELNWLRARCRRIAVIRELREAEEEDDSFAGAKGVGRRRKVAEDEGGRRLAQAVTLEERLREELDARLTAHREGGRFTLGLDRVCGEAGLGQEERLALLICLLPALGEEVAADTLAPVENGVFIYCIQGQTHGGLGGRSLGSWGLGRGWRSPKGS